MKNYSAEDLMVIYQQKSPELAFLAFDELYRRFSAKVFSFLLKKCKNQADAEDLLQKVFIKVHESKHLYQDKYKFEQWVFVIARTTLLDHFRANQRYVARVEKLAQQLGPQNGGPEVASPDYGLDLDLKRLDEDQREMLEMKYIDELSYQEMARLFNKSEVSLRKMVSRLMINFRKGEI